MTAIGLTAPHLLRERKYKPASFARIHQAISSPPGNAPQAAENQIGGHDEQE
jgi:hypothetical protein